MGCFFPPLALPRTASHEPYASSSSPTGRNKACQNQEKVLSTSSGRSTRRRSSLARMGRSLSTAGRRACTCGLQPICSSCWLSSLHTPGTPGSPPCPAPHPLSSGVSVQSPHISYQGLSGHSNSFLHPGPPKPLYPSLMPGVLGAYHA